MNRLIIIGNGFDLAHGLKTSSKDLIINYLDNVWNNLSTGSYNDSLIQVKQASEFIDRNSQTYKKENAIQLFKSIISDHPIGNHPYLSFNSSYLKSIFHKVERLNWADLETEYFNELFYIIEESNKWKNRSTGYNRIENDNLVNRQVSQLNEIIDYLKKILVEYLKNQQSLFFDKGVIDNTYVEHFKESISFGEKGKMLESSKPNSIYYLNFNYTNTLTKYGITSDVNQIHGTLDDEPIFGFGDDTSDKYTELENQYNNEFLKKIKSFKYLENSKHHDLITFLDKSDYQVHIYGHSCGVSDRTLFKQIFDSNGCKSIKVFYYDRRDFEDKMYEISRHFTDKRSFLEKVVTFDNLRPMPQVKQNYIA